MPEGNFFTDFNDILRGRVESRRARVAPLGSERYPARIQEPSGQGAASVAPRTAKTISDYLGILRRRWRLIVGTAALYAAVATAVTLQIAPRYRAEAVVLLDTRNVQMQEIKAALPTRPFDAAMVRGEIEVLRSRTLAEKVVDKLHLTEQPEFAGDETHDAGRRKQHAIDSLLSRLTVDNDGRSLVLKIGATAGNPRVAADIANSYAVLYLDEQIAAKEEATRRANDWLKRQIVALRGQIADTEEQVGKYKEEHDIVSAHDTTVSAQELADINAQLIAAHSDRVQKEAAFRYAKQVLGGPGGAEAAGQVVASPLLQRLREQEADLMRQIAELSARYRPAHPTMIRIEAELDDLRRKIADEVNRIVRTMAEEASAAQTREDALKSNLAELARSTARQESDQVQLRALERDADASRALYDSMLSRFKQISAQQDIQQPDAQIIARAEPPASPAWPDKRHLLASQAGLALILGIFAAGFLELFDQSFRRSEDVEELARLPVLGIVPAIGSRRSDQRRAEQQGAALSEALRGIRSGLRHARSGAPAGVLLVTSSAADEAKTFFAASLGRSVARARLRCLLIDCHFHRPGLAQLLSPAPTEGMLAPGTARYPQIQVEKNSGVHYIAAPAPEQRRLFRSQDLFESDEMRDYIQRMRGHYDLIILDAPPVPAIADVVALSRFADSTVFLVRWGRTSREVALNALRLLALRGVSVAGIVLTRVELRRYAAYGYRDYVRYLESNAMPAVGSAS